MNYKLVKLEYALLALFLFTLCTKLPEIVRVTGIFLNTPLLSMEAGDEYDLVATISPGTADNKTVIWTTSDLSVVSVLDGKVSANSAGSQFLMMVVLRQSVMLQFRQDLRICSLIKRI